MVAVMALPQPREATATNSQGVTNDMEAATMSRVYQKKEAVSVEQPQRKRSRLSITPTFPSRLGRLGKSLLEDDDTPAVRSSRRLSGLEPTDDDTEPQTPANLITRELPATPAAPRKDTVNKWVVALAEAGDDRRDKGSALLHNNRAVARISRPPQANQRVLHSDTVTQDARASKTRRRVSTSPPSEKVKKQRRRLRKRRSLDG